MSFDVASLFTNVPKDLHCSHGDSTVAMEIAQKYMEDDEDLEEHTLITMDNIILLLGYAPECYIYMYMYRHVPTSLHIHVHVPTSSSSRSVNSRPKEQ